MEQTLSFFQFSELQNYDISIQLQKLTFKSAAFLLRAASAA